MVSCTEFIFIYTLGGITFLPLLGLLGFLYIKGGIVPVLTTFQVNQEKEEIEISKDQKNVIVKKGWIRLINQYQPKMPDLSSSNNTGIVSGIQSYVNNNNSNNNKSSEYKKGVVYGVLKHGTLFCFESEKQKEVVMILPMQDYQVSLFAPSIEKKSDGEIYSRATVLRLVPNSYKDDINLTKSITATSIDSVCTLPEEDITCNPSRILYLTCARNIDKEDWYFGLLDAHHMLHDTPNEGLPYVMIDSTHFDQKALEKLIRQVQSTPNQREMSWLNAILGRVFLSTYKTDQLKSWFETKIRKKIDKTKRPTFLDEIHVRSVDVGDSAPFITSPKLLSLSTDGEVVVEANVEYAGGLTIEIETDFNWAYSSRMKPIRMHLILAVTLKKLAGRMMFKLKAPPTNRYWLAFFEMPDMEWNITPVVADKQIKLNIVTNAIESRIREVLLETFVLPNMNDISFLATNGKGGIFGERKKVPVKRNSDGVESSESKRTNSMQSMSPSNSNKSDLRSNSAIRENPTVPDSSEKEHAIDALKLKNRGAESVSNLIPGDNTILVPPQKLETSRSSPDVQQQQQQQQLTTNEQKTVTSQESVTSGSGRWSTSSYLRRRSKQSIEESDHSDTDSIKSNQSSNRFLNKFSSFLPSEQNGNSSDSISVRSTTNKKQAILNMAESFLSKRNSRNEDDDRLPPPSESKKEIYAQRVASMKKRVEEKILGRSLPPEPVMPVPPVKPLRGRSNTSVSERPPLPPRKYSMHTGQVDHQAILKSSHPESVKGIENTPTQKVINDAPREELDTSIEGNKITGIKVDTVRENNTDISKSSETIQKSDEKDIQDEQSPETVEDKVVVDEPETLLENKTVSEIMENKVEEEKDARETVKGDKHTSEIVDSHPLAPPLPTTPRPKRSDEDAKSMIPPRSLDQQHAHPPPVPPRSPNQQNAVPPIVPPRPH